MQTQQSSAIQEANDLRLALELSKLEENASSQPLTVAEQKALRARRREEKYSLARASELLRETREMDLSSGQQQMVKDVFSHHNEGVVASKSSRMHSQKLCMEKDCHEREAMCGHCWVHFYHYQCLALSNLEKVHQLKGSEPTSASIDAFDVAAEESAARALSAKLKGSRTEQHASSGSTSVGKAKHPPSRANHPKYSKLTTAPSPSSSSSVGSSAVPSSAPKASTPRHTVALDISADPNEAALKQANMVALELLTTERTYVKGLTSLGRVVQRLKLMQQLNRSPCLGPDDVAVIFQNVTDLHAMHSQFETELADLQGCQHMCPADSLLGKLGKLFLLYAPFFRVYTVYVLDYEVGLKRLHALRSSQPDVSSFFDLEEAMLGLDIESLMITPVQRVPRYLLLFKELTRILSVAPAPHLISFLPDLNAALADISQIATQINGSFMRRAAREQVVKLQGRISNKEKHLLACMGTTSFVTPNRFLVREGTVFKKYANRIRHLSSHDPIYLFLFNDLLIYCSVPIVADPRTAASLDCRGALLLEDTTVSVPPLTNLVLPLPSADDGSGVAGKSTYPYSICLASKTAKKELFLSWDIQEEMQLWLRDIQFYVRDARQKAADLHNNRVRVATQQGLK